MGLARASWARCVFDATINGAFNGYQIFHESFSSPYPTIMNVVAWFFLTKTTADDMLLMDIDILFTPNHLKWLLSHNLPFVGGIVPKRVRGLEFAMFPYEALAPDPHAPGAEPLISADFGRGFCVVKREVFEFMADKTESYLDEQMETPTELKDYYLPKRGGHSEDVAFCERYRLAGGKPVVDQRIQVHHEGSCVYPIAGTF